VLLGKRLALTGIAVCAAFTAYIYCSIEPITDALKAPNVQAVKRQVLDRFGEPLSFTFVSGWNTSDIVPLHRIPRLLQEACIAAEDQRFYQHSGVDWRARLGALWDNIKAARIVRGASTISEQVVSMLHPRSRSITTRILEGIEASSLERRFNKAEILEFYLNQAPFAAKRHGVAQAARYFWNRDLETLSEREQIALAVMLRAPERLNLYKDKHAADSRIDQLAMKLASKGILDQESLTNVLSERLTVGREPIPVKAEHFVQYVQQLVPGSEREIAPIRSTVDSGIQRSVKEILDTRIRDLKAKNVTDGAVLVLDNKSGEVLAWVNAGEFDTQAGGQIDAILAARQPGSTLKPFLYALALSRGWTAATIIEDSPLAEGVGAGLHTYNNYSRVHYGPVTLRVALGNSLNIPAVRAVERFGKEELLKLLHRAGFDSLNQPSDFYGEGLALGNGEVTLLELTRAYLALARRGVFTPITAVRGDPRLLERGEKRIFDPEVAEIISDILSDPQARRLEFGNDGLLNFPNQTAIKTGTSSDYRDAWAIGYSDNFTVGVWLGNLNRSAMSSISGARGPALVLRSIFSELEKGRDNRGLYLSPSLLLRSICLKSGELATPLCPSESEVFIPKTEPQSHCELEHHAEQRITRENTLLDSETRVKIELPTPGLNLAMDPRVPDEREAFAFQLSSATPLSEVRWFVDDLEVYNGDGSSLRYLWPLKPGRHLVKAKVREAKQARVFELPEVGIWVR
jgi:penicillin-binding protein 1C